MTKEHNITKEANPNDYEINELLLADDQCLIHENEDGLQSHIRELNSECSKYDMKISLEKIKT